MHAHTYAHKLVCSTCFRFIAVSTELEYHKFHSDSNICFALFFKKIVLTLFLPKCYGIADVIYISGTFGHTEKSSFLVLFR